MLAPASRDSRSITSAMVVSSRTCRAACAASAKTPCESRPSGPSSSSTISSTLIVAGSRAKRDPPLTPRWELMIPARRSTAKSCSRNCTGTSRLRASSPIGTGPAPALRPSSASASTAYGDLLVIEIIAVVRMSLDALRITLVIQNSSSRRASPQLLPLATLRTAPGSEPAALGRDQHRLRAVDRTELAVDVVQVGAHGARRQGQLVGDLLVDLALGEPLQDAELAPREWTGVDMALALVGGARQLVHHAPQLLWADADDPGALQ